LLDDRGEEFRSERLDLEVIEKDSEVDCLVFRIALESQVLLQYVHVVAVVPDFTVFQDFEQLLVTDLLSASR